MTPGPVPSARSALLRYGIAVAVVLASTLLALWLAPHSYRTPFLLFYPAVVLAVWIGGFWPGILATVLASLSVNYFMLPPQNAFNLDVPSVAQTIFFALTFASVCWFADMARKRLHGVIDVQSQLLEMSFDPVIVRDAEDRVIYWNKGAERLYGWTKDEAYGQVTHDLLRTVHRQPLERIRTELDQTGHWHGELIHTRKDGSTVAVESWWTLQKEGDRPSTILESNYDLTERKKAEESLRYLSAIVESSDAAIIGKTLDGTITSWNPGAARLYGYTAAEMIGQPISLLSRKGHVNEFPTILKRLGQGERIETYDTIRQHKDGTAIDISLKVSPIFDDTGKIIGASSIARDVRKRKHAERKIEELNRTLQQRNAELDSERARWKGVVEGIADEVWVSDAEGKISLINLPDVTQMDLMEFRDKSIQQVLDEVDIMYPDGQPRPPEQAPLLRSLRGEICRGEEIMRHRQTGKIRWRQFSSAPIRDATGAITGAVAIVRDVTEHKRMEEALRRNEERLRAATSAAEIGVWYWNPGGSYVEVSANWRQLFGVPPPAQVTFETWRDALHPEDRERAVAELHAAAEQRREFNSEYRIVRPDGAVRWIVDRGRAFYDDSGRSLSMAGINVDITERKLAQEALRESEQQFRTLADSIPQLAWMANPDGWIFWYNRRWYEYTGTTPEMMEGWGWQSVHDPEELPKVLERWRSSLQTGDDFDMVFPLRGADGKFRPFLTRVFPLRDAAGKIVRWFGTNTDISAQKQAEQALVKNEKLATVGRMAATIAHEINNPLAAAMNALYLVSADPGLPGSARGPLQLAEHELERVAHIAKQTLGFYREAGNAAKVQLPEVIDGILSLFGPKLKNHSLRVQRQFRSAAPAFGVEGEIRQIVSNLISNSIDAMAPNGTLHIRTCGPLCLNSERPMVRLTVADTGSGISPDSAAHIFEPFFTTKAAIGTGLGLWVTKELVTKHQGSIRMRSQVGKGTVFTIWLPSERRHGERMGSIGAA